MVLTSISLCEAILEREAAETRVSTDINAKERYERAYGLWLGEMRALCKAIPKIAEYHGGHCPECVYYTTGKPELQWASCSCGRGQS